MTIPVDIHAAREILRLTGVGQVVPSFLADEKGALVAVFLCVPCEEAMLWSSDGDLWLCPCCDYQLDRMHGLDMLEQAEAELRRVREGLTQKGKKKVPAKRRGGRRWLDIFRMGKRRSRSRS